MDDKELARRDFESRRHIAPIDQSADYRSEWERLDRARQQRLTDQSPGPIPPGYGDGDPRITLAALAAFVLAIFLFGGFGASMTGTMQLTMVGWAVLLVAIGSVCALLLSPMGQELVGLPKPTSLKARRFISMALLVTFCGLRLLGGSPSSGSIPQLIASAVAIALLAVGLLKWLTLQRALLVAIGSVVSVILLEGVLRHLVFPLMSTFG